MAELSNIINPVEAQRLREISEFEEMLTDDYLTNTNNIQTAFIYETFFRDINESKRKNRLKLLNISSNIVGLVSELFADYVGEPTTNLPLDIHQFVQARSWGGYGVFKCRLLDGKFFVEYAGPDGYIKQDDGTEILLTYIDVTKDKQTAKEKYVLKQTYTAGRIQNELYKYAVPIYDNSQNMNIWFQGNKVPLDSIAATAELAEEESTGISMNPIVVVHNSKTTDPRYGDSDVRRVRSLVSSLEIQLVSVQDQLLKHLSAKLAIPAAQAPMDKNGQLDVKQLEIILMEAGEEAPQYILNTNPLIDKAFENIDLLVRQIAARLSIPVGFFGIKEVGGAESGDAKVIRISSFIKKIGHIRDAFLVGLQKVDEIARAFGAKLEPFMCEWGEIFPVDKKQQLEEVALAVESRLMSRKRAIMIYNDMDEVTAQKELDAINEENADVDTAVLAL